MQVVLGLRYVWRDPQLHWQQRLAGRALCRAGYVSRYIWHSTFHCNLSRFHVDRFFEHRMSPKISSSHVSCGCVYFRDLASSFSRDQHDLYSPHRPPLPVLSG